MFFIIILYVLEVFTLLGEVICILLACERGRVLEREWAWDNFA